MPVLLEPLNGASISAALAEAAAYAPVTRAMLETLSLSHSTFTDLAGAPDDVRIVNDHADLVATLEDAAPLHAGEAVTFSALAVGTQWPEESDEGTPSFAITIDGVSGLVVQQLDRALSTLEPVLLTVRIYASDDTTGPANDPPLVLELAECTVTETRVTARAIYSDPVNRGFPGKDYVRDEHPGLSAR